MVTYNNLEPHPNVIQKWQSVGYLPDANRIPKAQSQAFKIMGTGKVIGLKDPASEDPRSPRIEELCIKTTEDPQRPIKRQIHKIYRIKNQDGKEWIYFVQHLAGENFTGDKPVDVSQMVGRYDEPDFMKVRNRETGIMTITGHKDGIHVYEIPYSTATGKFVDPSTGEQTSMEDLAQFVGVKAWFYVYTSGRKFELIGITYAQFVSSSYEDLVYYGQFNKWPEKEKQELKAV